MQKETLTPLGMKVEFLILLTLSVAGLVAAIGYAAVTAYRWVLT